MKQRQFKIKIGADVHVSLQFLFYIMSRGAKVNCIFNNS